MIEVTYSKKRHKVTVTGHARSGQEGHDLVCAAVSALTYTLAANAENLRSCGQVSKAVIRLDPGDAVIKCRTTDKFKSVVSVIFDSICVGFELLAANYPENISYKIKK